MIFLPEFSSIFTSGINILKLLSSVGFKVLLVYLLIRKLLVIALSILYISNAYIDFKYFSGYYTLKKAKYLKSYANIRLPKRVADGLLYGINNVVADNTAIII